MNPASPGPAPLLPPLDPGVQDELLAILFGDPRQCERALAQLLARPGVDAGAVRAHVDWHTQQVPPGRPGIPGYRLLRLIGEGGMGSVYEAEQVAPLRRKVAIKFVKPGMGRRDVVERFARERQSLAAMDHDGIAKVHDCGCTGDGQPFFVMEFVPGVPIHRFADEHRLTVAARLLLMRQVCAAVQHAHQKGIVHRDLKPGNILVHGEGDGARVKVIDFGLAKTIAAGPAADSFATEAGHVLGTPEYMAPEQVDPASVDVDTRADIYALGVLLYLLLVGDVPFPGDELRRLGWLRMQRLLAEVEPRRPSAKFAASACPVAVAAARRTTPAELAKALRDDLDWVVGKAIEKDRSRRYETASAMSDDLLRFLEHRPLAAGPPSTVYRWRKLLRRHRTAFAMAATVLVSLVGGAVATFVQYLRAEDAAATSKRLAQSESALKVRAETTAVTLATVVREFDLLKGVVRLDTALARERLLWPPWPEQAAAMAAWLRDEAEPLLAMVPEIERTLASLRQRALPVTPEQAAADRRFHPRHTEWEQLARRAASLRHADAIRSGRAPLVEPDLPAALRDLGRDDLNAFAWDRVAPTPAARPVWGEELLGLAAARQAAKLAAGLPFVSHFLDTLAWALVANGQDEAARRCSDAAVAAAAPDQRATYEAYRRQLEAAIVEAPARLAAVEGELAALAPILQAHRVWRFAPADDAVAFLHESLAGLIRRLQTFAGDAKSAVEQRLAWANQVPRLTAAHPRAAVPWAAARAAIAANAAYAGKDIDLGDDVVLGLVPIGENPVTGLWEFYDLRSAWDGTADPAALPIPAHDADGEIIVDGAPGIVFVLLPGGAHVLGSRIGEELARPDEGPYRATLAPFLIARHELTRAQWQRLAGPHPFSFVEGRTYDRDAVAVGPAHPAESVHWEEAMQWLGRHGMTLPTEAQWEYACRGGKATRWSTGTDAESLAGHANVHDATSALRHPEWGAASPLTDGFTALAPVGRFLPNDFGLYDVHGNVYEWCRDQGGAHGNERGDEGLRPDRAGALNERVIRGGSFLYPAVLARSAARSSSAAAFRANALGVRPIRRLRR